MANEWQTRNIIRLKLNELEQTVLTGTVIDSNLKKFYMVKFRKWCVVVCRET